MNASRNKPPPLPASARRPSPEQTLRRLFLTLFLRGRTARGLRKESAPKSVGSKLAFTLAIYALFGAMALAFLNQPVFTLALYLHSMTLVFLGMFVAASAGDVLFNKEEADILMHRPISPRTLLWAKIGVLVQVSLWLAGAFNLVGLFVGLGAQDSGWLFPVAHTISTGLQALFCTGCVVMVYQLCLRWFGRERLEGLMTTAQVMVAITVVMSGQLMPHMMNRFRGEFHLGDAWWISLVPTAWFAGFDDAVAGSGAGHSWIMAGLGLGVTAGVLWLAYGKLARDYEMGLQTLNEASAAPRRSRGQRRWIERLMNMPPLRWWLGDSVARASFLLTAAYLLRDRDVKLRIYPGIAPMMVMPLLFLIQDHGRQQENFGSGFGVAFTGSFLGLIPLLALNLLQFSQQWQAADLFRATPLAGPAALCHGARRAVLCFLTLPALLLFVLFAWVVQSAAAQLALLLPGLIALPVYALIPNLRGKSVPLSLPVEEAKSAGRGLSMFVVMLISMGLAGLAVWSWSGGWFRWLLVVEGVMVICFYTVMRRSLNHARWSPLE